MTGLAKPEPLARVRARKRRQTLRQRRAVRQTVMGQTTPCVALCGRAATQMHHEPPRSIGGEDSPETVAPLCDYCHNDRHAGLLKLKRVDGAWRVTRVYR